MQQSRYRKAALIQLGGFVVVKLACLMTQGCAADSEDYAAVAETAHEVMSDNGIDLNGIDLNGIDLNGIDLNGIDLNGIDLNGIDLNGIDLNGIDLNGIDLNGIDLNGIGHIDSSDLNINHIGLDGLYINGIGLNGVGVDGLGTSLVGTSGAGSSGIVIGGIGLTARTIEAIGTDGQGIEGVGLRGLAINGLRADGRGLYGITVQGAALIDVALNGVGSSRLVINGTGPTGIALGVQSPEAGLGSIHLSGTKLEGIGIENIGIRSNAPDLRNLGINGLVVDGNGPNALTINGKSLVEVALSELVVNQSGEHGILVRNASGNAVAFSAVQEKALQRVLHYLVGCALPEGDSLVITGSDGIPRSYFGVRGFAPEWADAPLTNADAQEVRTCLEASRGAYESAPFTPAQEQVLDTVLFHLVGCALPAGDSVTIQGSNGATIYQGLRGFAPEWKNGPLSQAGAERVRACLRTSPAAVFGLALNAEQEAYVDTLLTYMVQCALPHGQAVTIHSADGTPKFFTGTLGLAPEWAHGPLSPLGERLVSACLAARSNLKGKHVRISLRGGGLSTTAVERALYRHHEGAFWGNLFGDTPHMYTCSAAGADISGRQCTGGLCGFQSMGRCADVCASQDATDGHYSSCNGETAVLNTFLTITEQTASGQDHGCLRLDGALWCWGDNTDGQLGNGSFQSHAAPQPIAQLGQSVSEVEGGANHTCARRRDGSVWCWGDNTHGQLGIDSDELRHANPQHVTSMGYDVASLGVAANHTCALTTEGSLWCWGDNIHGQLGNGTNSSASLPVHVAALATNVARLGLGDSAAHTCAVTNEGSLWCWGWNSAGQLGNGALADRSTPVQVAQTRNGSSFANLTDVCTGWLHTCARRADGTLWCWGSNADGQLGNDAAAHTFESRPIQVDLPGQAAQGGLSCGANHTCTTLSNGTLWCWGDNEDGQLGKPSLGAALAREPVQVSGLGSQVASVSADDDRTCATLNNGTLWCWGDDSNGQLFEQANNSATPVQISVPNADRYVPVDLQVRYRVNGSNTLRWDAHMAPDLDGYEVYRDGFLVATVSANRVRWRDRSASGDRCYQVRAIFEDGTASALTSAICGPN